MIRQFHDYAATKAYSDFERLPKGGYVVKILGVSVEQYRDNEETLKISCDICEGEHTDFYANAYRANSNEDKRWGCNYLLNVPTDDGTERDGWRKRAFKTAIEAIEDSNPGFRWAWNETALKGLIVGALFNEREYVGNDGNVKRSTNLARFVPAEKIRTGNYTLPNDRLLEQPTSVNNGFMAIPSGADDSGLPFN